MLKTSVSEGAKYLAKLLRGRFPRPSGPFAFPIHKFSSVVCTSSLVKWSLSTFDGLELSEFFDNPN